MKPGIKSTEAAGMLGLPSIAAMITAFEPERVKQVLAVADPLTVRIAIVTAGCLIALYGAYRTFYKVAQLKHRTDG